MWSPSPEFQSTADAVLSRILARATDFREQAIRDGLAKLAARGVRGGVDMRLECEVAATSIQAVGRDGVTELLDLLRTVHVTPPHGSTDWVRSQLALTLDVCVSSILKTSRQRIARLRIPTAQAHVEGELQRERAAAARDVNIALAPFDLRRQAGTEHLFEQRTDMKPTTIYNLTGPQARVNIHSIDASTNVVNVSAFSLFDSIREGEVVGCDGLARADMHTASATNHRPKPTLSRAGWHPNKLIAARTYRGTTHVPVTRSCQLSDECTIVQMAPAVDTVNVTATRRKLQVSLDLRLPESGAFWVAATPA